MDGDRGVDGLVPLCRTRRGLRLAMAVGARDGRHVISERAIRRQGGLCCDGCGDAVVVAVDAVDAVDAAARRARMGTGRVHARRTESSRLATMRNCVRSATRSRAKKGIWLVAIAQGHIRLSQPKPRGTRPPFQATGAASEPGGPYFGLVTWGEWKRGFDRWTEDSQVISLHGVFHLLFILFYFILFFHPSTIWPAACLLAAAYPPLQLGLSIKQPRTQLPL